MRDGIRPAMTPSEAEQEYQRMIREQEVRWLGEQAVREIECEATYQDVLKRLKRDGYIQEPTP